MSLHAPRINENFKIPRKRLQPAKKYYKRIDTYCKVSLFKIRPIVITVPSNTCAFAPATTQSKS